MSTPTTSSGSASAAPRPEINRVVRSSIDFGSAANVLTDAAARVLGVNRTDMRLVAVIRTHRQLPTSRLASLARLSPAATTTAVRRLVTAGYVEQTGDPRDGRRVMVSLTERAAVELSRLYGPMIEQGRAHLDQLDSHDLELIEEFLRFVESLLLDRARELDRLVPLAPGPTI